MGIQGLLPFLKKIHKPVNIAQFYGCTVAIDAYCWLHKGAFSCAEKLALKEDTDQYVFYCLKYINYILSKDIKPIMVFDGCHLESKADVEKTRRERRELHRKKAAQFLREGKRSEAKECLQKCVDITPQMALKLIQACRDKGVDCIVAPYEADAQLAYLNLSGIAQVIVTEDSDLLLFGCDKIIFKMDLFGNGTLIEKDNLNQVLAVQSGFYTFEKFRHMCILSGCDYLPSLPGIGLAKSNKVFKLARQGDVRQVLKKLPTYLKMNIGVSDDYVEGFIRADNTFLYQLVFDPLNRVLKPLNPYPPELQGVDLGYAGHHIPKQMAYQIAIGNIDIHTRETMADFDPDTFVAKHPLTTKYRHQLSIWDKNYAIKTGSPCKEIQPSSLMDPADNNSIIARGRIAPKTRVIKLSRMSDEHQNPVLKVTEVLDMYDTKQESPKKVSKKRMFADLDDYSEKQDSPKRGFDHNESNSLNEMLGSDENNISPAKRQKIKYDASNIGEEAFKEENIPQCKETNKAKNCSKPRNIFAVKSNGNANSSIETKSKYFLNNQKPTANNISTPDIDHTSSSKITGNSPSDLETSVSKKETPKPLSLKEMFKNLKDKQVLQEDKPLIENIGSLKEAEKVETSASVCGNRQKCRTPSAFSWSKFKFNSSSDSKKSPKSHSDLSSSKSTSTDSFSKLLSSENDCSSTNVASTSTSNKDSRTSFLSLKQQSKSNDEEAVSTKSCEVLPSSGQNSLITIDSDIKKLKSQSYKSFLKSLMASNDKSSEELERGEPAQCSDTRMTSDVGSVLKF